MDTGYIWSGSFKSVGRQGQNELGAPDTEIHAYVCRAPGSPI